MFIDFNVKGSSFENNVKLADEAFRYGWDNINFSYNQNDLKEALSFKKELQDYFNKKIDYSLEIKSDNISEIRKIVKKFRKKNLSISVRGGDLKVNRAVLENIQIDVLSRPYFKRYDCGMNQVLSKEAVKNNVAVELSFGDILNSYLSRRAKILSNFKDIYVLHRKFNFPLILSTRGNSVYDIKTPQDIIAFFKQTGLTDLEINQAFKNAYDILDYNEHRDDLILKGVRRVNDEA